MNTNHLKHDDPCPCGSAKTYRTCCFAAGFNWYWDLEGTPHRSLVYAHPYPQNFARHRSERWNTIDQHILKALRSFVGRTLNSVEYGTWWREQRLGENAPDGDGVEGFIKLTVGDEPYWIEDDCMLGMLEEFCLTCRQEDATPYIQTAESKNVSQSNVWGRFIGQTIDRVSLHGYSEIPMMVEMHFPVGTLLFGLRWALDDNDFDGEFFAAVGTHEADFFDPTLDNIWRSDRDVIEN